MESNIQPPVKKLQEVNVALFRYADEGVCFVYAPALDILGYGKDAQEAEASFRLMLEEFLTYAKAEGVLDAELKGLGWHISPDKPAISPAFASLLARDEVLADVINRLDFTKTHRHIALV